MKKIILILVVFIIFALVSCKNNQNSEIIISNETRPYEKLNEQDFDVALYDLNVIPIVFMERLYRLDSYTKHTVGKTIAKAVVNYTQSIDNYYEKSSDKNYLLTKSSSLLLKVYHEAYFSNVVSVRDSNKDEFSDLSYDDYNNIYGYTPDSYQVEGFILSHDNIISVEKTIDNNYKVTIDGNKDGSIRLKTQMKKFAGVNEDPDFVKVEIIIKMNNDFTPIDITFHSEYYINYSLLGRVLCIQDYVVTYEIK